MYNKEKQIFREHSVKLVTEADEERGMRVVY